MKSYVEDGAKSSLKPVENVSLIEGLFDFYSAFDPPKSLG